MAMGRVGVGFALSHPQTGPRKHLPIPAPSPDSLMPSMFGFEHHPAVIDHIVTCDDLGVNGLDAHVLNAASHHNFLNLDGVVVGHMG
ncbi:hypothetical protein L1049_000027 [Liquidambar formosana]|uniref:Uncharacterized protein n=1 Tax=Liquidambar formosana TaxID=63359 RepID=A0AAP0N7W5_LIQFO